jgi:hypothetical protein
VCPTVPADLMQRISFRSSQKATRNSAVQFPSGSRTVPLVAPHPCCGVVSNGCCDVSALSEAVFKFSAAPLLAPKPAIACTS